MIASMTCVVLAWAVQWSESTFKPYEDWADDGGWDDYDPDFVEVNGLATGSNVFLTVVILFYLAEIIPNATCTCKISNQTVNGYQVVGDQVV
jgi:hypothetical protein